VTLHERRLKSRFDVVAVCSEADRGRLGNDPDVRVIPNGFEAPAIEPCRTPTSPPRIGFIGLLEYEPNAEGVRWFVDHCWPTLRDRVPGIRFRLAGKGGAPLLGRPVEGVDVLGWIEDAAVEMSTWSLAVIPMRSGAGTRIKLVDAFSRRCPVVATSLGAYGYDVRDRVELRLADEAQAFANACLDLLDDTAAAQSMADRAFSAYQHCWTWDAIAPRVLEAAAAARCAAPQRSRLVGST
jgi:glycosyltransferase involved in cell wall biosynthesis